MKDQSIKLILKRIYYPLILLFVITLASSFFALVQSHNRFESESDRALADQFFKLSKNALLSRNLFELNALLEATIPPHVYVRVELADNFDIKFPKQYFSSVWNEKPNVEQRYPLASNQALIVKIWNKNTRVHPSLWYLLLGGLFFSGVVVFSISIRTVRLWLSDLEKVSQYLYSDIPSPVNSLHHPFFQEVTLLAERGRQGERALRQKENELINAQQLSDLASQVAHDIRSPLTVLNILLERIQVEKQEHRKIVKEAVERIQNIANQLLEKYRPTGKNPLLPTATTTQLQEVGNLTRRLLVEKRAQYASRKNLRFEFSGASKPVMVRVSSLDLLRTLSNIVDNSVEALDKDENYVRFTLDCESSEVRLKVSDNGKGIPPEILPRLMNRGATFIKKNGLGLGLYYGKKSLESWGGSLEIHSELGRGTEVTITLPRALDA